MSISIEKSERFQNEYKMFRDKISNISDLRIKTELEHELTKLLQAVKNLDASHRNAITKNTLPDLIDSERQQIWEIRRRIDKTIRDYDKANSFK